MKTTFLTVQKTFTYWGEHFVVKMMVDSIGGQVGVYVSYDGVLNLPFYEALESDTSWPFVKDHNKILSNINNLPFLENVLDALAYIERHRRNKR